jgi:hypothetical protein
MSINLFIKIVASLLSYDGKDNADIIAINAGECLI